MDTHPANIDVRAGKRQKKVTTAAWPGKDYNIYLDFKGAKMSSQRPLVKQGKRAGAILRRDLLVGVSSCAPSQVADWAMPSGSSLGVTGLGMEDLEPPG